MKVRVSYEALPSSSDYENVRGDVERQLPLRNLHWVRKTGANRTIRTIQALPVEFKPLDSFGPNQSALSLLARPYLHVLFVVCDVSMRPDHKEAPDSLTRVHRATRHIVQRYELKFANGSTLSLLGSTRNG